MLSNLVIAGLFLVSSINIGGYILNVALQDNKPAIYFAMDMENMMNALYSSPEDISFIYTPPAECTWVKEEKAYYCSDNKLIIKSVKITPNAVQDFNEEMTNTNIDDLFSSDLYNKEGHGLIEITYSILKKDKYLDETMVFWFVSNKKDTCGLGKNDFGIHKTYDILSENTPFSSLDAETGKITFTKEREIIDTLCPNYYIINEEDTSLSGFLNKITKNYCGSGINGRKTSFDAKISLPVWKFYLSSNTDNILCVNEYFFTKTQDILDSDGNIIESGYFKKISVSTPPSEPKDYLSYEKYCINLTEVFANSYCEDYEFFFDFTEANNEILDKINYVYEFQVSITPNDKSINVRAVTGDGS